MKRIFALVGALGLTATIALGFGGFGPGGGGGGSVPIATDNVAGKVKGGGVGIDIAADGTLNATGEAISGVIAFSSISTALRDPAALGTIGAATSAQGATADAAVPKATYDAHTILYATTDNTPAALTVTEQTIVGRATGGNIAPLAIDSDLSSVSANDDTVPSAKATKAVTDTLVTKALFDANTILAANSDNTPAALTIAEDRLIGRATGGNIAGIGLGTGLSITGGNLTIGTLNQNTSGNAGTATALAADPADCTNQFARGIAASGAAACASVAATDITNNTITASQLAAALTFADGDFLDLSGITMSGTNDEGIAIPFWADVTPANGATKRFFTWDEAGGVLKVYTAGGWVTINPSAGAPTDVAYLTTGSLSGSLSAERLLAEGLAIDFTDAGANGNFTIAFDPTELTGNRTWAAGGAASVIWTWDNNGTTDPTLTFGDGLISTNSSVTLATGKNLTIGTTQLNSGDKLDGTKVAAADLGDMTVSAGGGWTVDAGTITAAKLASADFGPFTNSAGTITMDADSINDTHIDWGTGANQVSMDDVPDGTSFQKVAAADVNASNHVDNIYTTDATPRAVTFNGLSATRAVTLPDIATPSLPALNNANTFTENNTFGNADTDTLTLRSLLVGGNSRAVQIAASLATPTYATGTNELYVAGDIETPGTVYAAGFNGGTGSDGSRALTLASNTTVTPAGDQFYFVNDVAKISENGTERDIVTPADSVTWTGTSHSFAGVTNFAIPTATPDANNEIGINNTNETFLMYINGGLKTFDFTGDSSGYVLKSNGSGLFTLAADETAGSPTLNSVGNPTADTTIAMDASEEVNFQYTGNFTTGSQFFIQQLTGNPSGGVLFEVRAADTDVTAARIGDGTNYTQFAQSGAITLAGTSTITAGGLVLGDTTPDANGEIGYASNAYLGFANSEDFTLTASANLWTFASNTSAAYAFTPSVAFNGGITAPTGQSVALAGTTYIAGGADPADSGFIRMSNNTALAWEQSTPGTDIFIALDGSDILQVGQNAAQINLGTSGTGNVTVTGDLTVTGSDINVGAAGVKLTGDGDGAITFLGLGNGSDEDLTLNLDDTADTGVLSSSTGLNKLDFSAIGLATTGVITGGSATPVIDDPDNFAANFTGANLYGGTFIANAAGTAALPAVAVGMNFTVVLEGANAVILNPDSTGTADTIYMNGLAAAQDENITSSTSGAICVFQYRAADTWMATCSNFAEATPP